MQIKLFGTDVETTGFEADDGHMVTEIAIEIITLETETMEVVNRKAWSTLVDPQRTIPEKIQDITKITPEMVKGAPIWSDIAAKVHKVMASCDVFIAHNAQFDATFLYHMFAKAGLEMPNIDVFCTMQTGRWATPTGKVPKLIELCQACGVEFDGLAAHRANYDTRKMMDSLMVSLKSGYVNIEQIIGEKAA